MPIIEESGERKRKRAGWYWLLAGVFTFGLLALSFNRPLDGKLGETVTICGWGYQSSERVVEVTSDDLPVNGYDYEINRRTYRITGVAHIRSLCVGGVFVMLAWCRGRRVK